MRRTMLISATLSIALSGLLPVARTAVDVVTLPVKVVSAGVDAATTSQSEADEKRGRELRKADEERGSSCARSRSAAARASRCRPTIADPPARAKRAGRCAISSTPNSTASAARCSPRAGARGRRGILPDARLGRRARALGRAQRRALSRHVPVGLVSPRMSRARGRRRASPHYLAGDPEPMIVADWPEDIAQFCMLLMTGPGRWCRPAAHLPASCRLPASAPPPTARCRTMRCTTRGRCAITCWALEPCGGSV